MSTTLRTYIQRVPHLIQVAELVGKAVEIAPVLLLNALHELPSTRVPLAVRVGQGSILVAQLRQRIPVVPVVCFQQQLATIEPASVLWATLAA